MVLVKTPDVASVRGLIRQAMAPCQKPGVRLTVDLDPHNLL
jgi:hypothetical protein